MSDTPRTDAAVSDEHDPAAAVGHLCRTMERELTAANERIKRLRRALQRLVDTPDNRSLEDFTGEELEAWDHATAVLENE